MAIIAYTGLPGSGKSYGVTHHILVPAFKRGTPVYTNIPLKLDNIYEDFPDAEVTQLTTDDFRPDKLEELYTSKNGVVCYTRGEKTWAEIPNGALIVVDEIGTIYPMRSKQTDFTDSFVENWTMHRHKLDSNGISQEIVIICQNLNQVSKFIRELVDKTFNAVKLDSVGASKFFRTDIYQGAATGQKPPLSQRISYNTSKYNKKYFRYYESHTLKEKSGVDIQGKSVSNRANVLKSPFFMFVLPVMILFAIFCGYYVFNNFFIDADDLKEIEKAKKEQTTNTQVNNQYIQHKPTNDNSYSFFGGQKNDNGQEVTIYRDYAYNGYIQTSSGKKYAILQRKDEKPDIVSYDKYCKTNAHHETTCHYMGRKYIHIV